MSKTKQSVGKVKLSPTSNISGVKLLKNFAPSLRRRRQCEKEKLDIYNLEANEDQNGGWDEISPITPPAAFRGALRRGNFRPHVLRALDIMRERLEGRISVNL